MSSQRAAIAGPGVPAPIGPYSAAVRLGDALYVSGQPGVDPDTAQPVGPGFAEQARQAFRNLEAVLRAGGSRPELVVNVTVLVADAASFAELNEIFALVFPVDPPARMTMQAPLPMGLLISVGCVAAVDNDD